MQFRRANISTSIKDARITGFPHGKTIYTHIAPSIPIRLKLFQKPTLKTFRRKYRKISL